MRDKRYVVFKYVYHRLWITFNIDDTVGNIWYRGLILSLLFTSAQRYKMLSDWNTNAKYKFAVGFVDLLNPP